VKQTSPHGTATSLNSATTRESLIPGLDYMRESFYQIQQEAGGKASLNTVRQLAFAMACSTGIGATISTMGPLSAKSIGARTSVATFTVGAISAGTSVAALFAGSLFATFGRRRGFVLGTVCFAVGGLLGILAMHIKEPLVEILGCFVIGLGVGLSNFLRFAAVESTLPTFKARAITFVLMGGLAAAVMGPLGGEASIGMIPDNPFVGCFIVILCFTALCCFLVVTVDFNTRAYVQDTKTNRVKYSQQRPSMLLFQRPSVLSPNECTPEAQAGEKDVPALPEVDVDEDLSAVLWSPTFTAAVGMTAFAQAIMIMLMSTVTLAMSDIFQFKARTSSYVIMLHILGMFAPGFWTGKFIGKYGVVAVTAVGMLFYAIAVTIMFFTLHLAGFILAMILVGIGWNLGYTSGSVLLLSSYREGSKLAPIVQSRHDFLVLLLAGCASFGGGEIYQFYEWNGVLIATIIMIGAQACAVLFAWRIRHKYLANKTTVLRASLHDSRRPSLSETGDISMHLAEELRIAIDQKASREPAEPAEMHDTIEVEVATPEGMQNLRESIDGGVFIVPPTPVGSPRSATDIAYFSRESLTAENEINAIRASLGVERRSDVYTASDPYFRSKRSNSSGMERHSSLEGVNPYYDRSRSNSNINSNSVNSPEAAAAATETETETGNPLFHPSATSLPAGQGLGRKPLTRTLSSSGRKTKAMKATETEAAAEVR